MTLDVLQLSRRGFFGMGAGAAALSALPVSLAQAGGHSGGFTAEPVSYHTVKLGQFTITTILDGAISLPGPHPIFGQDQEAAAVRKLAQDNFLPPEQQVISFTPVLVDTGNETILFDTGNGAGRRPNAGKLKSIFEHVGFDPAEIDIVVLTHFHGDHIGGMVEDGQDMFPNARYVTGAAEYDFWTGPAKDIEALKKRIPLIESNVAKFAEKMTFLKPGQDVVTGITMQDGFGHTPGHGVYHIESDGKRLMLMADTANHFVVSLQRPDWHVRFDMDKEKAAETRKRLFGMIAADRIPFTGYHMPFPAVGYVEAMGEGFRFVPASYQFAI
ncbi:MAG: MBL fold metallo-hydrolase [Alphaproteobacteria bacterium]|nr:MBL fold metallo-hydrolase [Alphaproteobacteria bacterium]